MRALALCAVLGFVVALGGCGGGDEEKKPPPVITGTLNPAAQKVAQEYVDAYAVKNAARICAVLAPDIQTEIAKNGGSCLKGMQKAIKGTTPAVGLTVGETRSTGDTAHALIVGQIRQITLKKIAGRWKIVDGGT